MGVYMYVCVCVGGRGGGGGGGGGLEMSLHACVCVWRHVYYCPYNNLYHMIFYLQDVGSIIGKVSTFFPS